MSSKCKSMTVARILINKKPRATPKVKQKSGSKPETDMEVEHVKHFSATNTILY